MEIPPQVLAPALELSMASPVDVRFTAEHVLDVIDRDVPGVLVECGAWRGGCGAAMVLAQQHRYGHVPRKAYLLDSFQGLPPADERDGPLAAAWQSDTDAPTYMDNCRADLDRVQADLEALDLPAGSWQLVPGWFADTLPGLARELQDEGIALLRLDGDWYESTQVCLEHLEPLVHEDGVIVLDDYYAWDGFARAVHDYLSRNDLPYRIRDIPGGIGAYMVKRAARTDPMSL